MRLLASSPSFPLRAGQEGERPPLRPITQAVRASLGVIGTVAERLRKTPQVGLPRPACGDRERERGSLARVARLLALILGALAFVARVDAAEFDLTHALWGQVLAQRVTNARVDYEGIKANPVPLRSYLASVAAVGTNEFARWNRSDRLALLLNLYNAATVQLVTEHYPIEGIRKIGLVPGSAWKRKFIQFGGKTISLDELEHGMIRPGYAEPRIHFALVCAAKGCPALRSEPYIGDRLETQLDDQARLFLSDTARNRFDAKAGVLWLSPIFDWYGTDFTTDGRTLPAFVAAYLPAPAAAELRAAPTPPRIRFTEYDWSLNDAAPVRR